MSKQSFIAWAKDKLIVDELTAWRKFELRRVNRRGGRSFNPEHTRGDIGDWILSQIEACEDTTAVHVLFDNAIKRVEYKAVQATRLEFENAFADALDAARNGEITRRRWATIVRSLIKRYGAVAYRDGLEDGGVDPEEMTDDDLAEITRLTREASQYVTALGDELFKAITDAQAERKPAMWWNRSMTPFYDAGLLSADQNGMYEWVIGSTEEHCKTCLKANGQRHRLKSWHNSGILPQSTGYKELECGGWECDCNLVKTNGKARGKLSSIPTG